MTICLSNVVLIETLSRLMEYISIYSIQINVGITAENEI